MTSTGLRLVLALAALPAVLSRTGIPANKRVQDWSEEDGKKYAIGLAETTAVCGLAIWVLWMLLQTACCCYCCCAPRPSAKITRDRPRLARMQSYSQLVQARLLDKLPGTQGFFIGGVILLVSLVACMFGVWGYWTNFESAGVDVYDGVDGFVLDFANFICSEDRSENCQSMTVGDFLQDSKSLATEVFDDVYAYLGELNSLTDGLNAAIDDTNAAVVALNSMDDTMQRINDNITLANQVLDDLNALSVPDLRPYLPSNIDPASDNNAIADALLSVTSSQTQAIQIQSDLTDYYNTGITNLMEDIDGDTTTGDTDERDEFFNAIDDILNEIFDLRDQVLDVHDNFHSYRSKYTGYLYNGKLGISLFFALPAIIFLLTTLCAGIVKTSCPLYLDMTFICFTQLFFCFLTGLVMLFAFFMGDVCEVDMELVRVNAGNYSFKIRSTTVMLADTIENVLRCGHDKHPDTDPNLAAIFYIQDEFNVSEYTDPVVQQMFDVQDYVVNQTDFVNQATAEIEELDTIFAAFDSSIISYDDSATEGINDCNSLLGQLPSYDMYNNRDNTTEQTKVYNFYAFDFSAYQSAIDVVNTELAKMTHIPGGVTSSQTPETVQYLTTDLMNTANWADPDGNGVGGGTDPAIYGSTTYQTVKQVVKALYENDTTTLNGIITTNNGVRDEVNLLKQYLIYIQTDIDVLNQQEDTVMNAGDYVVADLDKTITDIGYATNNLTAQIQNIDDIVDFVATAPDYLGCAWIGKAYTETWETSWCEDGVGALHDAYVPMVAITLLMVFVFGLSSLYIPVLADAKLAKMRKTIKSIPRTNDNASPTTSGSTPIATMPMYAEGAPVEAVDAQVVELVEMKTDVEAANVPKTDEYMKEESRPSSSKRKKMTF